MFTALLVTVLCSFIATATVFLRLMDRISELEKFKRYHVDQQEAKFELVETDISNIVIELHKKVSKEDALYKEMAKVLKDANSDGEGFFVVRKMDPDEFFMRLDPKEIYKRSRQ